jgi:hypothetical protein
MRGKKMKAILVLGLTLFLVIGLSIEFYSVQVMADSDFATELAVAIGVDPADLIAATFSVDEVAGAVVSGSVGFLAPIEGNTFVMISSGNAQPIEFYDGWVGTPTDTLGVINENPNGTGPSGEPACDIATLNLTLSVPEWANSLSFNFRFMSEEYPYWVGKDFNDFFSCLLDGKNIAFDTEDNIINVNNNFFDGTISTEGTVFNATTVLLTSKAPVTGGTTVELDFIVSDVSDEWLDSAVFLDNFRFGTKEIEAPTTEPTQEEYSLTVDVEGDGAVELSASGPYAFGETVELTAVPDAGWVFSGWSGDLSGSANPTSIIMDDNKNAIANFNIETTPVEDTTDPIAEAGTDQTAVTDSTVNFNAEGSSDNVGITKYEWDFGDGTTGVGVTTTHTYKEPGNYLVTLTVEDEAENTATDSCMITVEASEIAAEEVEREPRSLSTVAQVALVGTAAVAASAAAASSGSVGQTINSAVSKLPIPDWLKDFLQLYGEDVFETVDKTELAAMEEVPLISKGELASISISAVAMTIVFCFVEANGLPDFLNPSVLVAVIPYVLLAVLMENVVEVFAEAVCARVCRVYRQVKLWLYGFALFLVSSLLLRFPTGSPIITRYQSGQISERQKGLIILSKLLILLTLTFPFAGLYMLGFTILGDTGLLMTLMIVFYYSIPLKPIVGKVVFDYKKWASLLALVSTGALFFSFALNLLPHIVYLVAGVVSLVLVAFSLYLLSKSPSEITKPTSNV